MAAGLRNIKIKLSGEAAMDKAVGNVEGSLRSVDTAARNAASGLDRAGEAADGSEQKAQGLADTLTGTKDLMDASALIAKGDLFNGFVLAGQGAADLAGGLASFVIPAMKGLTFASVKNKVAMIGQRIATVAATVATKAMAAGMWLLNAAMRANPIGIVITIIMALVGAIVLAWNKSETFRRIVTGAWNAVKSAVSAVVNWFTGTAWPWMRRVWDGIVAGVTNMRDRVVGAWNWIRNKVSGVVSGIKGFLGGMWDGIVSGAKAAINTAIRFVNGAIRGINRVTDVVGIPGIPEIPLLAKGGIVTRPTLAVLGEAGSEAVIPLDRAGEFGLDGGGGPTIIENHIEIGGEVVRVIRTELRKHDRSLRRQVMA